MEYESNEKAAEEAENGTQVAHSEVQDMALNNEVADYQPRPSRIDQLRGEANNEQRPGASRNTSRQSSSILRGRRRAARDEARRNETQSREESYRRHIASLSPSGLPAVTASINESFRGVPPGGFGLAGAEFCVNPNFVEPGYAELNPEYAQGVNARPVWGLAKPLPRVVRKSMVPSATEITSAKNEKKNRASVDLEAGGLAKSKLSRLDRQRTARERAYFCKRHGTFHTHGEDEHGNESDEGGEADIGLTRPTEALTVTADNASSITEMHELEGMSWHNGVGPDGVVLMDRCLMENHNHHTHWAVIRSQYKEPLAELLAQTVSMTLGFCANLSVGIGTNYYGFITCWAWGLSTMIGIYIAGGISGAHLNPAISIMLWIFRGFPARKIPLYVVAQTLGAFIAALISFGLYQQDIIYYTGKDLAATGTAADFVTGPRFPFVTAPVAFFSEFVGTALLAITVMALGDDSNAPPGAGVNAVVLGFVVTVHSIAFGKNTGGALNPSRDFGPRLACLALGYGSELFKNGYWVYGPWVATITGAIFGAGVYDTMIFVGGESPINYSRCRMKRAARLWQGRMRERCKKVPGRLGLKRSRTKVQKGESRKPAAS